MPKASIVIPTYNAEAFIKATLESIFSQTYQDFECIVVDDGSTDTTANIIKSYSDARLRYHYIENSGGPARPRNIGLQLAAGEFIFLFDADDVMHPEKLEISIDAFQQYPEADFLFTNYSSIDTKDSVLKDNYLQEYDSLWKLLPAVNSKNAQLIKREVLYPALVKVNFIGTSGVALRKSQLSDSDSFNERLRNSDDRLFLINFAKRHHGIFINRCLHLYRITASGISNRDFSERGIGKIEALKLIKSGCTDKKLIKHIDSQIAKDYATVAYDYKSKKRARQQFRNAMESINYQFNWWALKLATHSLLRILGNRISGRNQHE